MSKMRSITLGVGTPLTLQRAVELLKRADLSIFDKDGRVHIISRETFDEEIYDYTYEQFITLPKDVRFRVYGNEIKEAEICIVTQNGLDYLDILFLAYLKTVRISDTEQFDFNFYYDRIVNKMNEISYVVEHVTFDEV